MEDKTKSERANKRTIRVKNVAGRTDSSERWIRKLRAPKVIPAFKIIEYPPEELLNRFLSLPPGQRDAEFQPVKVVAFNLGTHPSTIRRWIDEGRIRAVKIVGSIYVHLPSVTEALKRSQG
jgi:excisionase family DNA binding protein